MSGSRTPRACAAALLAAALGCAGGNVDSVDVGRRAPSYSANTLAEVPVSVEDLRGKVVLLNVWATWCAPCREEIPYLEQLHQRERDRGLEVIGVSIDARGEGDRIASFMREMEMTYPIWLDPDQRVTATFFAFGVPASYLIDREGVLRWKHVGVLRPSNTSFNAALEAALRTAKAEN